MRSLSHDLRFAWRVLRKSPVLTAAAVVSLAIGIGVNTTLFTLLHGVFLRPLAVPDLGRIVSFYTHQEGQEEALPRISYPNFEDVAEHASTVGELAAIAFAPATWMPREGDPESLNGQAVSSSFFRLLGVEAELGRTFLPEEDEPPGAHPVVVLNHHAWTSRFGADPGIVGRTLDLGARTFTVVGVAPRGFDGTLMSVRPAFWVPLSMLDDFVPPAQRGWLENRRAMPTRAYGKLAPGVSLEQARAEVAALGRSLAEQHPEANGDRGLDVVPLAEAVLDPGQRRDFARAGMLLAVVVGLVLLVACGNVANLLLGRAAARRREIAVRLALGAPRSRLVGQLLTESVLLALLAGALGLLLALAGRSVLWSLRPAELADFHVDLALDPPVLAFTLALSLATGLLFGLAPAFQASRPELLDDLKRESGRAPDAGGLFSLRNLLVMVQVALCLTALVFSGLALRGLGRAAEVDLGFVPEGLAAFRLELSRRGLEPGQGEQLIDRALELARAVPGVEAATLAVGLPLSGGMLWRTVLVEGRDPEAADNAVLAPVNAVEPGYFRTLGIPLLEGRDLDPRDRRESPPVAVVNRAAARLLWPDEGALGRRFGLFGTPEVREVVGVVADAKHEAVGEEPQPQIYLSRRQSYHPDLWVVVRSGGDPAAALATLRNELRLLDPALAVSDMGTLEERAAESLGGARLATALLGLLGGLTLVLASVGVYGVTAYSIQQRRSEIGLRMALGAERATVLRMVLRQGMTVVALGLAAGLLLAGPGARLVEGLLYGLSPSDPLTFAGTALLLAGVALVANAIPAARATGVDPVRVLRPER
ncbi:MAG TPA: ABC transporter permease [Thermoanaerobaculia bacterium]|nr:ABC transporter permease [Thermoanaerobaculia bacterium]